MGVPVEVEPSSESYSGYVWLGEGHQIGYVHPVFWRGMARGEWYDRSEDRRLKFAHRIAMLIAEDKQCSILLREELIDRKANQKED